MDKDTAVKIMQRRLNHLNKRIQTNCGSETALMFDTREKEAIEFIIKELSPSLLAEEVENFNVKVV